MEQTPDFDAIKREVFLTVRKGGPQRLLQHLRMVSQGPNGREILRRLGSAQDDASGATLLIHAAEPDMMSRTGIRCSITNDIIARVWPVEDAHAVAACRFLIDEVGVDVNDRGGTQVSALEEAVSRHCHPVVKLLLQNGADGQSRATALHMAGYFNDSYAMKLLLEFGVDAEIMGVEGTTALTLAAKEGDKWTVERLLGGGVNIFRKDAMGRTAAEVARAAGHEKLARRITTENQQRLMREVEELAGSKM